MMALGLDYGCLDVCCSYPGRQNAEVWIDDAPRKALSAQDYSAKNIRAKLAWRSSGGLRQTAELDGFFDIAA